LAAAAADRVGFAALSSATTRAVLVAGGLGAAALVAVAPAVTAVFAALSGGGEAASVVTAMSGALVRMAVGVVAYGLLFHASRILFALERGRAAVIGLSTGWLAVGEAAVVLTAAGARRDPEPPLGSVATVHALGTAVSLGMVAGAVLLLLLVRRAAGPGSLAGLQRSGGVLAGAAVLGGAGGHLTTLVVAGLPLPWHRGPGLGSIATYLEVGVVRAAVAAFVGGAVALVVVGVAVLVADRSTLVAVRAVAASPGSDTPDAPRPA
ncbi:MAG TPA: hypothetical protein PKB06_13335, partial [Actinotalea sp.]|nr:hypothetical protein [Actinotalea sp.]